MKIGDSKPISSVAKYAARIRSSEAAPAAARVVADSATVLGIGAGELTPKVRDALMQLMAEVDSLRRELEQSRARSEYLERLADQDSLAPVANRRAFVRALARLLALGARALHLAIGWLADHLDRLLLVILSILFIIAGLFVMPHVIAAPTWNMVFIFFFGGVLASLYALALILLGERFEGADLASATTVFGVMWGLGSIVGPPLGGQSMELWAPHGLPPMVGLLRLLYLPFPLVDYVNNKRRNS